MGALVGAVVQKSKLGVFNSQRKTQKHQGQQKQQPVPEYEEIIELKENTAYGPVQQ